MACHVRPILALAVIGLLFGCRERRIEVSDPFYLDYIEDPRAVNLRVCSDNGCAAIDGLPSADAYGEGPHVVAAGSNANFIAVEQKQIGNDEGPSIYYYFERRFDSKSGGAAHPQKIVGPLNEEHFRSAKYRLGLPELTVKP